MKKLLILITLMITATVYATPVDTYKFKSEENQERALGLAHSLRCPQCQNQNLVDSNSPVAKDLRQQVYLMVDEGKKDDEIISFMTQRYGDFVLYKPRLDSKTLVLWLGPIFLLLVGLGIGFSIIRRPKNVVAQNLSDEDKQKLAELLNKDSN